MFPVIYFRRYILGGCTFDGYINIDVILCLLRKSQKSNHVNPIVRKISEIHDNSKNILPAWKDAFYVV